MLDMRIDAPVECADGACGATVCVIVNPDDHRLTHLVIRDATLPGDSKTRLVPAEYVANVRPRKVKLSCSRADVEDLAPFLEPHVVEESRSGGAFTTGQAYGAQYVVDDTAYDSFLAGEMPANSIALYSGMQVEASDGKVGTLDELVLDPESREVTQLRVRRSHLWGTKDVGIPVSKVDIVDTKTVYLKIDKAAVEALPAVQPRT